jgi:hypothetical protein
MNRIVLTVIAIVTLVAAFSSADGRTLGESIDHLAPAQFAALGQAPRAHLEALSALSRLFALRREGAVARYEADAEIARWLEVLAVEQRGLQKRIQKPVLQVLMKLHSDVIVEELDAIVQASERYEGSPLPGAAWDWAASFSNGESRTEDCFKHYEKCMDACFLAGSLWDRVKCALKCMVELADCLLSWDRP